MSATIDGVPWQAYLGVATSDTEVPYVSVQAFSRANYRAFYFYARRQAGSYTIGDHGSIFFNITAIDNLWSATSGTLTIVLATPQGLSGTFDFVADDGFDRSKVITVTDGKFSVTFY
jgi:hypothetical protein